MKRKAFDKRRPGKKRRLTKEGWNFLVELLHVAGYGAKGPDGNLVVRKRLREQFFHALKPNAPNYAALEEKAKEARDAAYLNEGARLQRLRPGHPQEAVSDETLQAICDLPGLNSGLHYDTPDVMQLFRQISDPQKKTIDFLLFCRRLLVSRSKPEKGEYKLGSNSESQLKEEPGKESIHYGAFSFAIWDLSGGIDLIPEPIGLRIIYTPVVSIEEDIVTEGYFNLFVPLESIGDLFAVATAYLNEMEDGSDSVMLADEKGIATDVIIKLGRDEPNGKDRKSSSSAKPWLSITTNISGKERWRVKLRPRDLISLVEACKITAQSAVQAGTRRQRSKRLPSELDSKMLRAAQALLKANGINLLKS